MEDTHGSDGWAYLDFVEELAADRERGIVRALDEYLRSHPGQESVVRRAFAELAAAGTPDSRTDARPDSAEAVGSSASPLDHATESLGHYRRIRELGRGGQGVVYLAVDERLQRRVALKVLSRTPLGTEESLLRFRREAEVASKLEHPGICTVYDASLERGAAYIAMRYVEGETLAQRLSRLRAGRVAEAGARESATSDSTNRETIRAFVSIVEKIARALHAAHEAGIVHRDVKPGNVMLTERDAPVVLDFGLARDTDGGGATLTLTGDLFGTPAYMSPEQLTRGSMQLDRRTDVWSLGVILYECLALRRPFEAPTRDALTRAILGQEPTDVRQLNPAVSRDLRTVVEVSLAKERDRRYQTAELLADELRAILERRPIAAKRTGPIGRSVRWARREPVRAALLLVLVTALPVIAGLATYAIVTRPEVQKQRVAELQQRTERLLEEGFLQLGEGNSADALVAFREAITQSPRSPEGAAGMALLCMKMGRPTDALAALGDPRDESPEGAGFALLRADALRASGRDAEADALVSAAPEPRDAIDFYVLVERELALGHDGDPGAFGRALELCDELLVRAPGRRALFLYQRAHVIGHLREPDRSRKIAAALASAWPRENTARFWAGFAFHESGLLTEAVAEYREAIRLRPDYVGAHDSLATVLRLQGLYDEAIAEYRAALAIDPEHRRSLMQLGNLLVARRRYDDGIARLRACAALEPDDPRVHNELGVALDRAGRPDEALGEYREALRLDPDYAIARFNLGWALAQAQRWEEAERELREAIRLQPGYANARATLGRVLAARGSLDDGIAELRQAVDLDPEDPEHHFNLGKLLQMKGSSEDAIAEYRAAIRRDHDRGDAYTNLGSVHAARTEWDEAIAAWREAVRIDPDNAVAHYNIGLVLKRQGSPEQAAEHYEQAIRARPDYAKAHYNLALIRMDEGRLDDAIAGFREVIRCDARHAKSHCMLGRALMQAERYAEALEPLREGHTLGSMDPDWRIPSEQWLRECEAVVSKENEDRK